MTATRPTEAEDRQSPPLEANRRGAHRARPRPLPSGLPVVAGLAVVLLVLGGGWTMLRGNGGDDTDVNVSAAETPTASASAGASPGPSTGPSDPAPSVTPTPTPSAPATPSGDGGTGPGNGAGGADVNRDIDLRVLNSTSTKGLAARVQTRAASDGWKVDETGNSINRNLPVTKIYYGLTRNRATAEALRDDLGFGTVVRDGEVAKTGLVVVLGEDAT